MTTGRYCRISPRFWQDPRVRSWSEDARTLALYLRTSPHANMVGLYYCPVAYMTADLQWTEARLRRALDELIRAGYALYDHETQVVLVPETLSDDPPQNPNQVKGAAVLVSQLPTTPLVRHLVDAALKVCPALADILRNGCETLAAGASNRSETVAQPLPNGSASVSNTGTDTRIPIPKSETDTGTDTHAASDDAGCSGVTPQRVAELWNEICGGLMPRVTTLTDKRRQKLRARLSRPGREEEWWRAYFTRIRASPFCCGEGARGWTADFDWAIRSEDVIARVLEGRYDGRERPAGAGQRLTMTADAEALVAHIYAARAGAGGGDDP